MRHAIAIGICSLAIVSAGAAAQTAAEQDAILGDFQRSVVDYTQQHQWPAPKIFTLPVAMVFRQLIAAAIATGESGVAIRGTVIPRHPAVLQPFPDAEVAEFPKVLSDALPLLPPPLEYRLIGNDLVIRDADVDVIVAVLVDALGRIGTK